MRPGRGTRPVILALLPPFLLAGIGGHLRAEAQGGTGIHTLYLIRHGDYDSDDPRDPDTGKGLTPLGEEQARIVGQRLVNLGVTLDSLHTSTMRRARETAAIIAPAVGLPALPTSDIRECTPPASRADVRANLEPEEAAACSTQLERAFARFFRPSPAHDLHEVLVCHGNVIRYLVCRTLGVDSEAWANMTIANCSITVVEVRPDGGLRLVSFDDIGHMPVDKQTYTGKKRPQAAPAR